MEETAKPGLVYVINAQRFLGVNHVRSEPGTDLSKV